MYVIAVTIFVKPEFLEPFKEATLDNARNTRKEPLNVRFDVLQHEEDPTRFLLYEAYQSKDDCHRPPADGALQPVEDKGRRLDGPAAAAGDTQQPVLRRWGLTA